MTGIDLLLMAAVVIGAYVVYDYLQTRDRWAQDEYERRLQELEQVEEERDELQKALDAVMLREDFQEAWNIARAQREKPRSIRELVDRGK